MRLDIHGKPPVQVFQLYSKRLQKGTRFNGIQSCIFVDFYEENHTLWAYLNRQILFTPCLCIQSAAAWIFGSLTLPHDWM